jgi:hypothetical protein
MEEQPGHRLAEEQKPVEEIRGGYTDPKRCVKCEVDKPLSEYYTYRNNGHFYYRSGCKGCSSAAAAAWNNKHRDRINQLRRKRYNNDPGVMRARSEREKRLAEERARLERWPETERSCRRCGETKPIDDFAKGDNGVLRRVCRECKAEQHRQWRANNTERVKDWHRKYAQTPERKAAHRDRQRHYHYKDPQAQADRNMRKKYGITLEQYQAMLEKQDGVCAVCGEGCKSGRALSVDHNHTTGQLRGLLCGNCNRGIGYLQDDPELIRAALEYILSYQ